MRVTKINIRNILGIEELEIEPGAITTIEGGNGQGKTSVLEAIKSLFAGGSDATLLRSGSDTGEVVMVLDNGTEIARRVTEKGTTLTVKHPEFGKLSRPQSAVETIAEIATVNPIHFLLLPSKRRTEYLLQACPITVSGDAIAEIADGLLPEDIIRTMPTNLDGLDRLRSKLYELRTACNVSAKEHRATVSQLRDSLSIIDDQNYDQAIDSATLQKDQLLKDLDEALQSVSQKQIDETTKISQHHSEAADHIRKIAEGAIRDLDAEIAELNERRQKVQAQLSESLAKQKECALVDQQSMLEISEKRKQNIRDEIRPKIQDLESDLIRLIESAKHIESHRKQLATITMMEERAIKNEQLSENYSNGIQKVDTMKRRLLDQLPIPDIEIRDGEIYRGDIPFDRLNTAQRVQIAIDLAKLNMGDLRLMCVDNAEMLDHESLTAIGTRAIEDGIQLVLTRVTDDNLTVRTLN